MDEYIVDLRWWGNFRYVRVPRVPKYIENRWGRIFSTDVVPGDFKSAAWKGLVNWSRGDHLYNLLIFYIHFSLFFFFLPYPLASIRSSCQEKKLIQRWHLPECALCTFTFEWVEPFADRVSQMSPACCRYCNFLW